MKIKPLDFFEFLINKEINYFTGVPDSLLKELCLCINESVPSNSHIITANEGTAVALASGYNLATGKIPLVYMQNSGIGNAINPLLSLCDAEVYSIPILLLIGWRGEPNIKDEPQHIKQGRIQKKLLETLEIPYVCISENDSNYKNKISSILDLAKEKSIPVAVLISKGTFEKHGDSNPLNSYEMVRENVLEIILHKLNEKSIVVSTTGKTSREIFEIRNKNNQSHSQDFLTVGSMGHCSSIALGIANSKPSEKVYCIDGDGSMIMHMGSLSSIPKLKPKNFKYILINNEAHESVGGQPTTAHNFKMKNVAKSMGYDLTLSVSRRVPFLSTTMYPLVSSG